jgi:hypothetical protein
MTARVVGFFAVLVALAGLAITRPARAEVTMRTSVSARKIEIGQSVQVQVVAVSAPGQQPPDNPALVAPPGVEMRGPSIGSYMQGDMLSRRMSVGIQATWILVPRRTGTLRVGPATVEAGGKRVRGEVVVIEVVPQGTLPRPRFDPFQFPFGSSPFPSPFQRAPFGEPDEPEELPPVPEELRVERAPDPVAFLRAVVTPKNPVVGEQVTLRIYAYGGRGNFSGASSTEPSRADFLAYTPADHGVEDQALRMRIGDAEFIAKKVNELALFPLHSGELVIGPMTLTFGGRGYRLPAPVVRSSERIVLNVVEPPLRGRPPGYKVGDVGELELTARVDPLRIVAGDGVSVVAKLSGTGNLPSSLVIPQQRGVEWAEPSTNEDIDNKGSVVSGFRVFKYVVTLSEPGRIDLGELTLPYFDPKRRAYALARAALGTVTVDPNPKKAALPAPSASAAPGGAAALPAARESLAAYVPPTSPFTDGFGFWALLFGAPLVVLVAGSGIELSRRMTDRMKSRRTAPDRLAADALREADEAARAGRAVETAGAVERALFRAIEAGTGLKARAFLRDELEKSLADAGIAQATVTSTLSVLDACEALRFTEGSSDGSPTALAERARSVASELARKRRRK